MAITVGWEEWVGLSDLGIPAIRAKVDTGAQTSALHAFSIHRVDSRGRARVRFGVHPLPEQPDVELFCEADLVAEREVTSSNGETELRFIVATRLAVGGQSWPIEISLTNRERMAYRMLLGRRALEDRAVVDVTRSCVHGAPEPSVYAGLRRAQHARRELSLGVLTGTPQAATAERIAETGAARGHTIHLIDLNRMTAMVTAAGPRLFYDEAPLPALDAVVPLFSRNDGAFGLAMLRQMEWAGLRALPGSAALAAAGDPLQTAQAFARAGVPAPAAGLARDPALAQSLAQRLGGAPLAVYRLAGVPFRRPARLETAQAVQLALQGAGRRAPAVLLASLTETEPRRRCLVIGRRLAAAIEVRAPNAETGRPRRARRIRVRKPERELAKRATRALRLEAAVVELADGAEEPAVREVVPLSDIRAFEDAAGIDAAALLLAHLERRFRR